MGYSLLPITMQRKAHQSLRVEIHSFDAFLVARFALTEVIDRRGDRPIREWGWKAPAQRWLPYSEMYTALRDLWDIEMGALGLADRHRPIQWEEQPRWNFKPTRTGH